MTASQQKATDRELVFTRVFKAPVAVVFDTWTDPVQIPHWWGPNGFTTTIHEMDVRPGGVWRLTLRGPDGRDYHNRIVFVEISKPNRLVYKHVPEPGSEPVDFETTVTFENDGGDTLVTLRMLFKTSSDRDYLVNTYHADEGAKQTLDRLAAHLDQMANANKHLVIKRILDAPREVVFKAWTDQAHLARWWGPRGFTNPVCEMDARPGGAIMIHMRAPNGIEYPMHGAVLEIVEPRLFVFSSGVNEADGSSRFEVRNTVTFTEHGKGQTELTLEVQVMSSTPAAQANLTGMEMGWTQTLDRLSEFVPILWRDERREPAQ